MVSVQTFNAVVPRDIYVTFGKPFSKVQQNATKDMDHRET